MPVLAPRCSGFLMKHQLPSAAPVDPSVLTEPYDIVPCPNAGAVPRKFGRPECQAATAPAVRARGCGKGHWCPHHWCAGCKRASGVKPDSNQAKADRPGELKMKKDEWVEHLASVQITQPTTTGAPALPA